MRHFSAVRRGMAYTDVQAARFAREGVILIVVISNNIPRRKGVSVVAKDTNCSSVPGR